MQIVKPASAKKAPTALACLYSTEFSPHREPPKIFTILSCAGYLKAIEEEDEQLLKDAHKVAKESLEQLLGVPIDKIKFNLSGMHLK